MSQAPVTPGPSGGFTLGATMNQHVEDKRRVDADMTISHLHVETQALLELHSKYPWVLNAKDKDHLGLLVRQLTRLVESL